jgi:hypothetical protein
MIAQNDYDRIYAAAGKAEQDVERLAPVII